MKPTKTKEESVRNIRFCTAFTFSVTKLLTFSKEGNFIFICCCCCGGSDGTAADATSSISAAVKFSFSLWNLKINTGNVWHACRSMSTLEAGGGEEEYRCMVKDHSNRATMISLMETLMMIIK